MNVLKFLFLAAILLVPINFDVLSFRLSDIFLLASFLVFLLIKSKLPRNFTVWFCMVMLILSLSTFFSFFWAKMDFYKLGFFYKYFSIYVVVCIAYCLGKCRSAAGSVFKSLFLIYCFLSAWVLFYFYAVEFGYIEGSSRPSYPLSRDYTQSDAHLYSSYLSFFFLAYFFDYRIRYRHGLYLSSFLMAFFLSALLLTGSRTGILVIVVGLVFYFILGIPLWVKKARFKFINLKDVLRFISFFVLVVFAFCLYLLNNADFSSMLSDMSTLSGRALDFDLRGDESALGRIEKLNIAILDSAYTHHIVGAGIMGATLIWYDGILALLLAHGGLALVLTVVFGLLFFIVNVLAQNRLCYEHKRKILTLVLVYILSNVVTEYVFVLRNMLPVLCFITIYYVEKMNSNKYVPS